MADGDIRVLESFDRYADTGTIGRMNAVWSTNYGFVAGRYFGGRAVSFEGSGNNGSQVYTYINEKIHKWTIGCAIKPDTRSWNSMLVATGPNGGITLGYGDNGRLEAVRGTYGNFYYNGSDLLGTGIMANAIISGVWQYVEFQVTQVAGQNTGDIKAWVNGELALELYGVAINRSGGFDGFGLSRRALAGNAAYDDFYVREGPTKLGEIKIESIVPVGTVSNTFPILVGAADAHSAVNENPVNGDTSYIAGSDVGNGARFTMGDMTAAPEAIQAVQVRAYARKDETAYRSIKNAIKVNAAEQKGAEHVLGTGYKFYRDIFPLNPETGAAWTQAAVDAMVCGVDIHA
jgi:hypothetical protein